MPQQQANATESISIELQQTKGSAERNLNYRFSR
jgi:hypothetical protein